MANPRRGTREDTVRTVRTTRCCAHRLNPPHDSYDLVAHWRAAPMRTHNARVSSEPIVEPRRLQAHIDIDLDPEHGLRALVLWWLDRVHDRFVDRWREDGGVRTGWSCASDVAHVEGEDDDPNARDRLGSALDGALESVSFSAHRRNVGEPLLVELKCHALLDEPSCLELRLDVHHSAAGGSPADTDALEAEVLDLVHEFLGAWRPSFVGLSDDFEPASFSLDAAQNLNGHVARLDKQHLRGYCWVTYCPSAFLSALPDLKASDAFVRIDTKPDGVLLQATEHLRHFSGPRVRTVRNVLAPVLRDRPTLPPRQLGAWMNKRHLRIAWDDGQDGPVAPPPTREERRALSAERNTDE
ncbi:MAG: hypothetical protein ACRDO4_18065 [Nocardioides sp.]